MSCNCNGLCFRGNMYAAAFYAAQLCAGEVAVACCASGSSARIPGEKKPWGDLKVTAKQGPFLGASEKSFPRNSGQEWHSEILCSLSNATQKPGALEMWARSPSAASDRPRSIPQLTPFTRSIFRCTSQNPRGSQGVPPKCKMCTNTCNTSHREPRWEATSGGVYSDDQLGLASPFEREHHLCYSLVLYL